MSEVIVLIVCCILTGWIVFDSTSVTIDSKEVDKINSYCKVNQGLEKIRFTTDGKSKVTCIDGAIFEVKASK